jgi:hypothetical protein
MRRQKICDEYGVTLDWLYLRDRSMLRYRIAIEIVRIEAERKCQPPSSLYISFLLTGFRFL